MAWYITEATPYAGDDASVGRGQWGQEGDETGRPSRGAMPFSFWLYDDDGELVYRGACDAPSADDDEDWGGLYQAFKWGQGNWGTTDLRMRYDDALALRLTSPIMADKLDKDGRVSIYG